MSRAAAALAVTLACAAPAVAQNYPSDWIRDLPAGGNVFALLESAQPEVTTARFNSGGLNGGAAERMSGFLGSWSQTRYMVGGADIASPVDGSPMLFPELEWWSDVDAFAAQGAANGLRIDMMPGTDRARRGVVEFIGSDAPLSQRSTAIAPAINQLERAYQISALVNGHKGDHNEFLLGAKYTAASTLERRTTSKAITRSLFG